MAEKSKPPALRVVGDPEHYYGKRYKADTGGINGLQKDPQPSDDQVSHEGESVET
jgi:hypothetical protein